MFAISPENKGHVSWTTVDIHNLERPFKVYGIRNWGHSVQQAALEQISMQQTSLQETVLQETVLQETVLQETVSLETLLQQGLDLTLYGMGIVYVFLGLLVVCTMIMSAVVDKFCREPRLDLVTAPARPASKSGVTPKTLAIIQAAIHEHRAHTHK